MRKLTINESVTTDSFTILAEQKRFYQNLYKSGRNESDDRYAAKSFLNNLIIPKLSEEEKRSCKGKILLNECELILETFQNNKAPGNDGIPVEFYKKLWPLIGEPFIKCVNECFENKEVSSSQKQAVITLIEKKRERSHIIRKLAANFSVKCRYKDNVESHSFEVKTCFT